MTRPSLPRRTVEDGDTNQPSRPLVPRLASAAEPWRTTRESGGCARGTARLPVHVRHAGAVDCIQKASIQSYTYVSISREFSNQFCRGKAALLNCLRKHLQRNFLEQIKLLHFQGIQSKFVRVRTGWRKGTHIGLQLP